MNVIGTTLDWSILALVARTVVSSVLGGIALTVILSAALMSGEIASELKNR
ncbi:hypothetical protein [Tessaracoccus rhinocerotis]|uniref:hypothetical protein n=1 Tax=Tessaracoccus rhinocerotis TaxID=1689449 RepID=UPI001FE69797|nr:hypothetical protein [Tessaracoccus rhinocerotis]